MPRFSAAVSEHHREHEELLVSLCVSCIVFRGRGPRKVREGGAPTDRHGIATDVEHGHADGRETTDRATGAPRRRSPSPKRGRAALLVRAPLRRSHRRPASHACCCSPWHPAARTDRGSGRGGRSGVRGVCAANPLWCRFCHAW